MAAVALRYLDLRVQRDTLNADRRRVPLPAPRVCITAALPGGNVREVDLTRGDLVALIESAARALRALDQAEAG